MMVALLLMAAGVQTVKAQKMVVTMSDDSKVVYNIMQVKDITFEEAEELDEHEWVDLGLPSGTLWATCNVGANSPEEYGDYFAWGETEPKESYSWSTYKWCNGSKNSMTKYCIYSSNGYNGFIDGLTELLPEDDAAMFNWGSDWQMPSLAQLQELSNSDYTTTTWTTQNGVKGRKITGKNGNSIFLPASGSRNGTSLYNLGKDGLFWLRSLSTDYSYNAYELEFTYSNIIYGDKCDRFYGHNVRPVRVQQ